MFPALIDSIKPPPVYTPAPYWKLANARNALPRRLPADNAMHSGFSTFISGDVETTNLSGEPFGPGGAVSLASQPGVLVGRGVDEVWICGSAAASCTLKRCVGVAMSRQAAGEFWICTDSYVSLVDENLNEEGRIPSNSAIDCCSAAKHPRVCILGGETIQRADMRTRSCQVLTCGKPTAYYAGWLTDWDGSSIYQWSAIATNPSAEFLLAAVSQRYRGLAIFDLRKTRSPLAEWSLPTHPIDVSLPLKGLEWSDSGTELIAFAAGSSRVFATSMAGRNEPLLSHMSLIEHSNPIMGACFDLVSETIEIYDSKSSLSSYNLEEALDQESETVFGVPSFESIQCDAFIRKFLDS